MSLLLNWSVRRTLWLVPWLSVVVMLACEQKQEFDPANPAAGPGQLVGRKTALNETFAGGVSADIEARSMEGNPDWQVCDAQCQSYCSEQQFENPVDEAMCPHLWGAGFDTLPIADAQACRRLYADLRGTFPTHDEIVAHCLGRSYSEVALSLIQGEDFVLQNQRRWADVLGYNNVAISIERIYDADGLVKKLYQGRLRYDEFVEVVSAHPVFVRRHDDASDRAEALFDTFVGRPPFDHERADMAKLYALWENGYHFHPDVGMSFPDAFIEHRCVDEEGKLDDDTAGRCTSVLWGFNRVVLYPDFRAIDNQTWTGNLTKKEWQLLQTPGRIIGAWPQTWEHAVSVVLEQYLGYDLSKSTPALVQKLVEYVLAHHGDIRAAHYAVVTSQIYLQSTECSDEECDPEVEVPEWTYGPMRQAEAELWVDSITAMTNEGFGACDHRLPLPEELLENSAMGYAVVQESRWSINDQDEVDERYASLVRTLGGCPDNITAGRFKAVSILNTATQEAFVNGLCNPAMTAGEGMKAQVLLPEGIAKETALDADVARRIVDRQVRRFFGREPTPAELEMADTGATSCVPKPCDAETFARSACYALLSSSEMLFY